MRTHTLAEIFAARDTRRVEAVDRLTRRRPLFDREMEEVPSHRVYQDREGRNVRENWRTCPCPECALQRIADREPAP